MGLKRRMSKDHCRCNKCLTKLCVYLRLTGLSYPKIVKELQNRGWKTLSWQAVQGRVNRYIDTEFRYCPT